MTPAHRVRSLAALLGVTPGGMTKVMLAGVSIWSLWAHSDQQADQATDEARRTVTQTVAREARSHGHLRVTLDSLTVEIQARDERMALLERKVRRLEARDSERAGKPRPAASPAPTPTPPADLDESDVDDEPAGPPEPPRKPNPVRRVLGAPSRILHLIFGG